MQTEVPTLPVVHFSAHKNPNRKQNSNLGRPSVETKANLPYKNVAGFSSKKKNLHPLLARPYQSNVHNCPSSEQSRFNKNSIEHRVLSAKMLRIKELQNQLADAHYQLNELSNENKLLKALQKRQDTALKHYEGTNAELPRIINSHHEELRVLQIKYKRLKALQKETCDLLKEKENELQQLQLQNKHLLQLSKDRNLEEREKLQLQVSDLNYRIQQQQDTIQTLHRKLTLETKSLKQQLHLEISKRKGTQKSLDETTEKLKTLEKFLDNRERRLYYNGQLSFPDKNRRFGTQSLMNLRDISSSNPLKLSDKNKKWQGDAQENNLPMLHTADPNDKNVKADERIKSNHALDSVKTETMANLEQVRKYRLQKSPNRKILDDPEEKSKELDLNTNKSSENSGILDNLDEQNENEISIDKFRQMYKSRKSQSFSRLLKTKSTYSSGGSDSENENSKNSYINATNNSKQLHIRLISSADDTSDSKELTLSDCKYRDKLKVLVRERTNSYESDSEVETEVNKQSIKDYLTKSQQNDKFKLISSIYDNETHYDSDKEIEKLTSSENILNGSQMLYQNLIDEAHIQTKNVENKSMYVQCDIKDVKTEYRNSGNLENYMFEQVRSGEWEYNNVNVIKEKLEDDTLSQAHFKKEEIENAVVPTEVEVPNKDTILENNDLETRNISNTQDSNKDLENAYAFHNMLTDVNAVNEISIKTKLTDYNKEKLLASMKAIDDNENIEFLSQDYEKRNIAGRKQVMTESVFQDLPTHTKKKQDIMKEIFDIDVIKSESSDNYNKLH